jgi:hypothetical protein
MALEPTRTSYQSPWQNGGLSAVGMSGELPTTLIVLDDGTFAACSEYMA